MRMKYQIAIYFYLSTLHLRLHLQYGGVHTKKHSRTGTNVSGYYTLGLAHNKEAIDNINMMERGHQQNTWISAEHYGK
jgi:hypothetical protein